jgi:hypothetical protein
MLRKLFCALTITLALCGSALATNEIQYEGGAALTGQTLYYVLTVAGGDSEAGETWDGTNYVTYTTTRATFDVAMTETGVTGRFIGSLPTTANAINKPVIVTVYQDADDNGTPDHTNDIPLQVTTGYWNGVKFGNYDVRGPDVFYARVDNVVSQTDLLVTMSDASQGDFTGYMAIIYDVSTGNRHSVRQITSGGAEGFTIDSLADFTIAAGDSIAIIPPPQQVVDVGEAVESISPIVIGETRTWKFASRQQLTSPSIISETTEFEGTLAFDMTSALNPGQTIQSVTSTTIDAVDEEDDGDEPTVTSDDVAPDRRFVHITLDCSTAPTGDFIVEVRILTTDGQIMTRRGRLRLE